MQAGSATIAIIGGGFSGTVLAANLLRRPPANPTRIVLIERRPCIGCGVAYAPSGFPFLLNVPAARMSATSYEPAQLIEYARRQLPYADSETYLTREFYGEYLRDFLRAAEAAAPRHVQFERIHGEVSALCSQRPRGPIRVLLNEQSVSAEQVVLACGEPSPAARPYAMEVAHLSRYVGDPYRELPVKPTDRSVLLVGTGLTMVDVAVAAAAGDPTLKITALSRHGRLPSTQAESLQPVVLDARADLCGMLAGGSVRHALASARRRRAPVAERRPRHRLQRLGSPARVYRRCAVAAFARSRPGQPRSDRTRAAHRSARRPDRCRRPSLRSALLSGPMLRASHWEATAVGELRVRAEALAALLAKRELAPIPTETDQPEPEPAAWPRRLGYIAATYLTMTNC
jgi:cation diffusion facilitator CzcD-associated flavoprotein CzcO